MEKYDLSHLEALEDDIRTKIFNFEKAGRALRTVKDTHMYRKRKFLSFYRYAKKQFDIEKSYADDLIRGAEVIDSMEGLIDDKQLPTSLTHAVVLSWLKNPEDRADAMRLAWEKTRQLDDPILSLETLKEAIEHVKNLKGSLFHSTLGHDPDEVEVPHRLKAKQGDEEISITEIDQMVRATQWKNEKTREINSDIPPVDYSEFVNPRPKQQVPKQQVPGSRSMDTTPDEAHSITEKNSNSANFNSNRLGSPESVPRISPAPQSHNTASTRQSEPNLKQEQEQELAEAFKELKNQEAFTKNSNRTEKVKPRFGETVFGLSNTGVRNRKPPVHSKPPTEIPSLDKKARSSRENQEVPAAASDTFTEQSQPIQISTQSENGFSINLARFANALNYRGGLAARVASQSIAYLAALEIGKQTDCACDQTLLTFGDEIARRIEQDWEEIAFGLDEAEAPTSHDMAITLDDYGKARVKLHRLKVTFTLEVLDAQIWETYRHQTSDWPIKLDNNIQPDPTSRNSIQSDSPRQSLRQTSTQPELAQV